MKYLSQYLIVITLKDVWNRLTNNCGDNSGMFEQLIINEYQQGYQYI